MIQVNGNEGINQVVKKMIMKKTREILKNCEIELIHLHNVK